LRLGDAVKDIVQDPSTTAAAWQGTGMSSTATSSTTKSSLDPTIQFLDELPVIDDLDEISQLGIPTFQDNVGSLSVLFHQDEFSKTLEEHGTCTEEDPSTPTTVIQADTPLGTANLRSLNSSETNPSNYGSAVDTPSQVRALSAARNDDRGSHVTQLTYQKARESLTIAPSFQVFSGEIPSQGYHGLLRSSTPVPSWAFMSINRKSRSDPMNSAFGSIHTAATNSIRKGTPEKEVFGIHPDIAALLSEKGHQNASLLSQWAASMVHSTRNKGSFPYFQHVIPSESNLHAGNDFTCFAYMHVLWYLMRWMIAPSQQTYEALPQWLRPT
jgi:hypothetical protein